MIFVLAALPPPMPESEVVIVRAERLKEPSSGGLIVTGQTLQNQSGVRLDEALRIVPGIGLFRRTASGAANATIQGLSLRPIAPNGAGRALVSLDGVPQNDPFGGWIYWGRYDPLFLSQVDVKRGGAGAGFGPMALTGTLALSEARGQPNALTLNIGGMNSVHLAGRGSLQSNRAMFTAMASYDVSDGAYAIAPPQRGVADIPIDYHSFALALVTDIGRDNGAWSFRAAGFSEAKGAGLVGGQSSAQGLDVSIARRFEGDLGQSRVLIYAQGRGFTNQTVAVTARRSGVIPALDQYATPSSALGGSLTFIPSRGKNLPALTLDGRRAEGETRERFRFVGADFTRNRLAGGQQDFLGVGISLPRSVVFTKGNLQIDGAIRLDYWANHHGVRFETDRTSGAVTLSERPKNNSGAVVSGRVSLAQSQGPLQLSLYRTFRPPTLNELHRPFRVGNDVTEANAALEPETLIGLDFDLRDVRGFGSGALTTSLTVYANQLNDPIANVTLGAGPGTFPRIGFLPAGGSLRERRNAGRIEATGIEGSLSWGANKSALGVSLAASYTDARVDGGDLLPQLTGKRPAQAPSWSVASSMTLPITAALLLSVTVRSESDRFEDDLNTRRLAAYGALDLRAVWKLSRHIDVSVTGQNILNTAIATGQAGDGIVSLGQGKMVRLAVTMRQ
jgi:TonB dependent receptor/TonB-dependent Receptor Plug Domain